MQSSALANIVRHDMEQTVLPVLGLLRRSVERGEHDGLATAALAEHCNVLLQYSALLHIGNLRQSATDGVSSGVSKRFATSVTMNDQPPARSMIC